MNDSYKKIEELIYSGNDLCGLINLHNVVNIIDKSRMTLLSHAVAEGNYEASKRLIDSGSDINHQDCIGNAPLIESCLRGYYEITKLLLKKGANYEISNSKGETPLTSVAANGSNEILSLLLTCNIDINKPDKSGTTPLMWALSTNNLRIAEELLEYDVVVDTEDHQGKHTIDYINFTNHPIAIIQIFQHLDKENKNSVLLKLKNKCYLFRKILLSQ